MSHKHDTGHHTKADYEHELVDHDQWFRHTPNEHHQAAHGQTNPWGVGAVLLGTVVLVFVLAFYTLNIFERTQAADKIIKREIPTDKTLAADYLTNKANWDAELSKFDWVPNLEKKEIVRLPIDVAMKKVAAEYQAHDAKK